MTNNTSPAQWNDRPYWCKADLTTLVCKPLTLQHRSGEWKSHQSLSWWKPWSCFCWEVDWSTLTTCHWLLSCWLLFWSTSAPHMVLPWPLTPDSWAQRPVMMTLLTSVQSSRVSSALKHTKCTTKLFWLFELFKLYLVCCYICFF